MIIILLLGTLRRILRRKWKLEITFITELYYYAENAPAKGNCHWDGYQIYKGQIDIYVTKQTDGKSSGEVTAEIWEIISSE